MACAAREQPLPFALFGSLTGQPFEMRLDFRLVDQHLRGLRAFKCFLPFGQATEQPFFRAFGLAHMRSEHARPRPAQPRQRLQRRPRAFALRPVLALAGCHQNARRLLQQQGHARIVRRLVQSQRVRQPLGGGHAECGRMDESEQFEQVEPRQVGIAKPARHQRRIHQQLRRVGGGHHRLALRTAARRPIRIAQPGAGMAGMQRGEGKGLGHATALEHKRNAGQAPATTLRWAGLLSAIGRRWASAGCPELGGKRTSGFGNQQDAE